MRRVRQKYEKGYRQDKPHMPHPRMKRMEHTNDEDEMGLQPSLLRRRLKKGK